MRLYRIKDSFYFTESLTFSRIPAPYRQRLSGAAHVPKISYSSCTYLDVARRTQEEINLIDATFRLIEMGSTNVRGSSITQLHTIFSKWDVLEASFKPL
jgi:hypothetical protein